MLHLAQATANGFNPNRSDAGSRAGQAARQLYQRVCLLGWLGQIGSALSGRPRYLLNLAEIEANCSIHNRYSAGMQMAPICQIRGSQGRCNDFDQNFNPLQNHLKSRWLGVATARQLGKTLPPVELTQVGDIYFVRDGHHRISVAKALGQIEIEAEVRVWQTSEE
ncbi:MAG: hypothetical protein HYR94_04880 [Chloroflexi bacterium]|nr:hypothetical protein [Chloroflexota bacterium]